MTTDVTKKLAAGTIAAALLAAAAVSGCGGSSAYGGPSIGGGYPSPSPSPTQPPSPSPSPSPSPTPGLAASGMQVTTAGTYPGPFTNAPAASDNIVFSCGCSSQAGTGTTDGSGAFSVMNGTPATPGPGTYTIVATRNYVVVAQPASGLGPQAWTMEFAGNTNATDLALGDSGATAVTSATSDVYTAAATLYIWEETKAAGNATAFDKWNFNAIEMFVVHMASGHASNHEQTLINDIAAQSGLGNSLYPTHPSWDPSQPSNATILADTRAIRGTDPANVPTPCPSAGCTGTPTP